MRYQTTTHQRGITQARKLQPSVRQIEDSLMFDCASTSQLDAFHHVYLGPNKFNLFTGATCDCGTPKYLLCCHKAACFLFYFSRLEERLWKGADIITQMQDTRQPEFDIEDVTNFWLDLLDKYERCADLLKEIETGRDVSGFVGKVKEAVAC